MTEFVPVGNVSDVDANSMTAFEIDGWEVVVANIEGRYVAFDGRCTCMSLFSGHLDNTNPLNRHAEARALLSNGRLSEKTVTCPTHATIYNVDSGSPIKGPGEIPLNTYEVREEVGQLLVATSSDTERRFWNDAKAA